MTKYTLSKETREKYMGVATPTIAALIKLASLAVGIDYRREGLTLERLGIAGMSPADLLRFVHDGA